MKSNVITYSLDNNINGINFIAQNAHFDHLCLFSDARDHFILKSLKRWKKQKATQVKPNPDKESELCMRGKHSLNKNDFNENMPYQEIYASRQKKYMKLMEKWQVFCKFISKQSHFIKTNFQSIIQFTVSQLRVCLRFEQYFTHFLNIW